MTEHQPKPDTNEDPESLNRPGSQSSSGMSDRIDDSLLEAYERDKQRRGEDLDVPASALPGGAGTDAPAQQQNAANSPVNRNPEATDGHVVD